MEILFYIIVASLFISLGALIGIFTLAVREDKLSKILLSLVALSAGALMGSAFIHLLPEASEEISPEAVFNTTLFSFITFFVIEKLFHWRHCHDGHCDVHSFGYMNLFGDSIHNFIDGLILSATFMADFRLGLITTAAIALHEIPQEIGDFGVLLYAGFTKKKAVIYNLLVALTSVLGAVIGYFLYLQVHYFVPYLLSFAAGGFIYISASDLMPEIKKETNQKKSIFAFCVFLLGVLIMILAKSIGQE